MKNFSSRQLNGLSIKEIQVFVFKYYSQHLQGNTVRNAEKGISISFNRIGKNKTARPFMTVQKAMAIIHLKEILRDASYSNWREPKTKHKENYNAVGFMNFAYSCTVDGRKCNFRIPVMVTAAGKFQYDLHEHVH